MRILITGISGFVGGHLTEALHSEGGHTIGGVFRPGSGSSAAFPMEIQRFTAELADGAILQRIVEEFQPEWLFHLAGYANTGKSFKEPDRCWADNLEGTRTLYTAIANTKCRPKIVFASTGLIYGESGSPDGRCHESSELKPASPYAASKAAADLLGYQVSRNLGLHVVRVRLFNQFGPRQSADYAIANFARQIAAAEAGTLAPTIQTGDLSAHRDLTDVRDMVLALRLLAEHGKPGEAYNAGRGETFRIADVLTKLVELARVPVTVNQTIDPNRKADTAITRADPTRLMTLTGWKPRYTLAESLLATLDDWRARSSR
jgi:GDP-4-dehydro-6-deoxy-D-mannose reductase